MLIASSRATVGVMKSHAMARSDIPPSRNVVESFAGVMAMGFVSLKSASVAMIKFSRSRAPSQCWRAHRRIPMPPDFIVEHAQRQRCPRHLERRGDVADQRSRDAQALALEPLACGVE